MKVKPKPRMVHTPEHDIPFAEVYRTADGTRVILRIKKSRSQVYEEIDLWQLVQLVLDTLNAPDAAA